MIFVDRGLDLCCLERLAPLARTGSFNVQSSKFELSQRQGAKTQGEKAVRSSIPVFSRQPSDF